MAGKLTDLAVKGAKPQEKRYTLFDTGGLYLEVAPNGGKWWRFRYRLNGKQKVISLGTYPEVGLRNAREQRDAARTLLANGGDPARKKLEESENAQVPTFKSLAEEWFALKSREWVERHAIRIRQKMDKYLMGHLGPKPFADLMITDFLPILRSIEKRGKFETARRVAQICNQICRYARLSGIVTHNPVEDIAKILVMPKTQHFKTITDPKVIGCLLRDIRHYHGRPITAFALQIMPYVFVRSSELRGARWEEIDFGSATWIIPGERMKMRRPHIVPLATQVLALFNELKFFSGNEELCFPGSMSNSRPITDVALLNSLRRIGYGRDEM